MKLHVEGRHIKNSLNQTVILRGVNQAGMIDSPNGWWNPQGGGIYSGMAVWSPDAVKYNLDKMKEWGCNIVRLHTSIEWWVTNPSSYRQHIKDIITWAGERGIYVLVEPFWVKGIHPPVPWPPYIDEASGSLIITSSQDFVDYWASVANELKGYPNVLFEIFNEPHAEDAVFFPVVQQVITAIRATGAEQIIVVQQGYGICVNFDYPDGLPAGKLSWVEDYPLTDPLGNIAYSTHYYIGFFDWWNPATETREPKTTYDDIKLGMNYTLVNHVLFTLNKPVIFGEVGANMWESGEGLVRELAWFNNTLTILNELGVGYIGWVWTATAHLQHGLLQNELWCPPPNQAGEILIAKMAGIEPPPAGPTTPFLQEVEEAIYIVSLSPEVTVPTPTGNVIYVFKQWEDGSTNPTRTINLTSDMTLTATYELPPPPPPGKGYLDIHAFLNSQEIVIPYEVTEAMATGNTPDTIELDPGTYTVKATLGTETKTETRQVLEDQTVRVDFTFEALPTPPLPIIPVISATAGLILTGMAIS